MQPCRNSEWLRVLLVLDLSSRSMPRLSPTAPSKVSSATAKALTSRSRVRDHTAVRNLALLRKIALNIVGRNQTTKASVRARRKQAAWNDSYMLKLLVG